MEIQGAAASRRHQAVRNASSSVAEHLPRRLGLRQQVVVARQRHQSRIRDQRGQFLAVAHRNPVVVAGMHDQRRARHLLRQCRARRCGRTPRGNAPRSPGTWCAAADDRTPPSPHGCRRAGTARRTPAGTPDRHGPSPPGRDRDPVRRRAFPRRPTARTARPRAYALHSTSLADPLGMARRVRDRDRAALRHPEQRKSFQPERLDHRLQVGHPVVEGEIRCLPIG